jgi:hypothetical protein
MLTLTCIGCHAKSAGDPIDSEGELDIPQVFYNTGGDELAAGNFKYVTDGDEYGHNVHGWAMLDGGPIIWPDVKLKTPPGYVEGMDPSGHNFITEYPGMLSGRQVLCAGAFGCHGNRTILSQTKATVGTHHADDSALKIAQINVDEQGTSVGKSYRFLNGVKGIEDDDWEKSVSSTDHNEYYGTTLSARTSQPPTSVQPVQTMSQFCASCHGNFHMAGLTDGTGITPTADLNSPWIRHPTDVLIPDEPPYKNYVTYELTARVARKNLPPADSGKTEIQSGGGNAVVTCLSCHKAHASEFSDMLRFSYSNYLTGQGARGTGCFACHGDK